MPLPGQSTDRAQHNANSKWQYLLRCPFPTLSLRCCHRNLSSLVVLGFADENGAFALRSLLSDMEEEGVIEIGDAVIATRNARGKVRLHQSLPLVAARMAVGSFTGLVMGMLLLNPLFGVLAGAGAGALAGVLGDAGIDDAFMKKLGETLTPGSSALFVIVGKGRPRKWRSGSRHSPANSTCSRPICPRRTKPGFAGGSRMRRPLRHYHPTNPPPALDHPNHEATAITHSTIRTPCCLAGPAARHADARACLLSARGHAGRRGQRHRVVRADPRPDRRCDGLPDGSCPPREDRAQAEPPATRCN